MQNLINKEGRQSVPFGHGDIYGKGEYDGDNITSREAMTERPKDFSVKPNPPIVIKENGFVDYLPGETEEQYELRTKGKDADLYAEAAANTNHSTHLYDKTIPEVSKALDKNNSNFKNHLYNYFPTGELDPSQFQDENERLAKQWGREIEYVDR